MFAHSYNDTESRILWIILASFLLSIALTCSCSFAEKRESVQRTATADTFLSLAKCRENFCKPDSVKIQWYNSSCLINDKECLKREKSFIIFHGRLPATDSEIINTYNCTEEQLFGVGEPVVTHPEPLSLKINCEDCYTRIIMY